MEVQPHRLPNAILYDFDLPEWVQQKRNTDVNDLLNKFNIEIPLEDERAWTERFAKRCEQVASGYAWYKKVLRQTGRKTYKPAMRHYAPYQRMTEPQREELDKKVDQVKTIYENWDKIMLLCNRSDMIYVDVKKFSLFQLSRACETRWLEQYNKAHMPKTKRIIHREYEPEMIEAIINNEEGATDTILQHINNNKDQITLIGRDITKALLRRAEGEV